MAAVIRAMPITAGTKIPEIVSAMRAIGAFVPIASSTRRMICESVVSVPTRVARKRKEPFWLRVADTTVSPTVFSTGRLSPVIEDSSNEP